MNPIVRVTILICLVHFANPGFPQETEKPGDTNEQIQHLKEKIADLEKTVQNLQAVQSANDPEIEKPDTTGQSELEKELAKELGVDVTADAPQSSAPQTTSAARQSLFQNMNPNISVIGTVLGHATSLDAEDRNVDLSFEEGEFSFQAAVDPYAKADFYVAFGKHTEPPLTPDATEEEAHASVLEPEIEEAYLTLLSLPFSTQIKAGKFRSKFGKINDTHPHAYNFIDIPLMYSNFLGQEGLNDEGISLSWLLPNREFFQELTLQVTSGPSENNSFMRADDNRLLYLAHLKNFFDLNDDTTLELGVTGLTGPNDAGDRTNMVAADLTVKWKPLQRNRYKSFEWMNEFLLNKRNGDAADVTSIGLYSFLRYQIGKRWFLGALYDYSEFPEFSDFHHQAYSGIVQFFATEFQKLEFQYKYNNGNFFDNFSEFKMRAVFVIGAHGAHQY